MVQGEDEGRNVFEGYTLDTAARATARPRFDQAGRGVHPDDVEVPRQTHQPVLAEGRRQADDAVAAHGAIALVVHEQDAQVAVGPHGRRDEGAVHIGVAAGLPHQRRPQMVQVLAEEAALGQDGFAREVRETREDDPQRLARSVGFERPDLQHGERNHSTDPPAWQREGQK
jgi:hypothetical protein